MWIVHVVKLSLRKLSDLSINAITARGNYVHMFKCRLNGLFQRELRVVGYGNTKFMMWQDIGVGNVHSGNNKQGRSQPHSPGCARVPLSSLFPKILIIFFLFFLKLFSFSSSFWLSGWATRPPGKALAIREGGI